MISFITINYNGIADTLAMLESLYKNVTSVEHEVIVVDNGSNGHEAQAIAQAYPAAQVIETGKNLGFAGGNNEGIKVARGEYVMLINNDTLILDDHFDRLIAYMESHPDIGALSPLLCDATEPYAVQWAGYTPLSTITLRNNAIGQGEAADKFTQAAHTAFCHGAAMLARREAIAKAGLMPTVYFLYYEEYDWCTRIKEAGYTLAFVPFQTIYHKESRATGVGSPFKKYYLSRGRLLFARRNRHGLARCLSCAYLSTVVLLRDLMLNCTRAQHIKAALRGTWHGLRDPKTTPTT